MLYIQYQYDFGLSDAAIVWLLSGPFVPINKWPLGWQEEAGLRNKNNSVIAILANKYAFFIIHGVNCKKISLNFLKFP